MPEVEVYGQTFTVWALKNLQSLQPQRVLVLTFYIEGLLCAHLPLFIW